MRIKKMGSWIQYSGPGGRTFYFNEETGFFQWERPAGVSSFKSASDFGPGGFGGGPGGPGGPVGPGGPALPGKAEDEEEDEEDYDGEEGWDEGVGGGFYDENGEWVEGEWDEDEGGYGAEAYEEEEEQEERGED